jgi:hypothetical protein
MRINEFAARELNMAQEQMLLLGRRTAEEKVASFLVSWRERLAQIGDEQSTISLPMSRQDIADYLGLTIETVSRTLTRFEREKMLIIVTGGVRLLDADRAAAMAAAYQASALVNPAEWTALLTHVKAAIEARRHAFSVSIGDRSHAHRFPARHCRRCRDVRAVRSGPVLG